MIAIVIGAVVALLCVILAAEYEWWGGRSADLLVRISVRAQRPEHRDRFREEWTRHLLDLREEDDCPGLIWALGNVAKALYVRSAATWEADAAEAEGPGVRPAPAASEVKTWTMQAALRMAPWMRDLFPDRAVVVDEVVLTDDGDEFHVEVKRVRTKRPWTR